MGGNLSVYPLVFIWLLRRRAKLDAVLDCQNGIPFFSPLAVGRTVPVVMLMHHVHQEQFGLHFGAQLARVGRFLEGPVSRIAYRDRPIIAVSPSTRAEIRRLLRLPSPIYVVPNGVSPAVGGARTPTLTPSLVSVGRLVTQKRLSHALEALAEAQKVLPDLTLDIVGDGRELLPLRQQAERLGLEDSVVFHGRASEAERDRLISQSWIFLSPSEREGWGVAVLEAASHGVPAITYDVPGLRDSVRDELTGWLVPKGCSMADVIVHAVDRLTEPRQLDAYAKRCRDWAANFGWVRTGERVSGILESESTRLQGRRPPREPLDLVTRVEIRFDRAAVRLRHPPSERRRTDDWRWTPMQLTGLLYGTDERGAHQALKRLGLHESASMSVARSYELLGDLPDLLESEAETPETHPDGSGPMPRHVESAE